MGGPRIDDLKFRLRNLLRDHGFEVVLVSPPSRVPVKANSLLALHLHWLFAAGQVDTVLDVGGHVGEYGVFLRRNGFEGKIVSFEPVQGNFEQLARRSAPDCRWDVVNIALGSEDCTADINVAKSTSLSSFFEPSAYALHLFGMEAEVDHVEHVAVRRLDGVLDELLPDWRARCMYLKMDTQGWDLEVLAGATDVLPSTVAFQSEVSVQAIGNGMPSFEESIRDFEKRGFSLSGLFPVSLDPQFRVVEFDCVCVADELVTAAGGA